ncbi:MAG: sugar ABC transporter permease [Clostridiales bacterium]|jgi:putative aldouronate transport system permease protein|nr:sugar ABC transporter permease [Clostridiales bacterium]
MRAATSTSVPVRKNTSYVSLFRKDFSKNWMLFLMCVPAILFFLLFSYIPMPGVYLAFVRYNYADGIFKSPFIGLENFRFLWLSGDLWRITRNTLLYNIAFILLGNTVQITVAVLMNELRSQWFRKTSQTLMFLPFFISYVLVGLFVYNFLSFEYGTLNSILRSLGREPVETYSNPAIWKYVIVLTHIWKNTGYGSIVYFAAIMGLDPEMYEAAEIDGASAWQRIRYITLPCLRPTFVILLLFALGGILKGNFDLFYNLVGSNTRLYPTTDIIETFVFRSMIVSFNFSSAAAVGFYQSIFGFLLVMTVNWIVRKIEPDYALF